MPSKESALPTVSWQVFFAETQPYEERRVPSELTYLSRDNRGDHYKLVLPNVSLPCRNCRGARLFEPSSTENVHASYSVQAFLYFSCKNCERDIAIFAVRIGDVKEKSCTAMKYGQSPRFGIALPQSIEAVVMGDDATLLQKALVAESEGLGVGAFSYYRRVLDNQRVRIIERVREAVELLGGDATLLHDLDIAKSERQFTKAVEAIKHALPRALYVEGHNPLTLLYDAVSNGLHAETDPECLDSAKSIRTLLAHLLMKIDEVLASHDEVKGAVNRLLAAKAKRQDPKRADSAPSAKPAATPEQGKP